MRVERRKGTWGDGPCGVGVDGFRSTGYEAGVPWAGVRRVNVVASARALQVCCLAVVVVKVEQVAPGQSVEG